MFPLQASQPIKHAERLRDVRLPHRFCNDADAPRWRGGATRAKHSVGTILALIGGSASGTCPLLRRCAVVVILAMLASCSTSRVATKVTTTVATTTTTVITTTTVATTTTAVTTTVAATTTTAAKPIPKAVLSLSPTATETIFALGAGTQVKAVDNQSTYPPSAPRIELGGAAPDLEKVVAQTPDLVIISDDTSGIANMLTARGITVLVQPPATSLDDAYTQIRQLGVTLGRAKESEQLVSAMKTKIDTIVAKKPAAPVRYYHERNDQFGSVTSNSFLGQLYGLLNLRSIADRTGDAGNNAPTLTAEAVIEANPDLIIAADTKCCHQTVDTIRGRPGWSALTAVSTNAVVVVDDDLANRWGPRIVDLLQAVSARLVARTTS